MSGQDRARVIAEQIVNEDVRDELGGYVYWIDNHSCGTYGCCGGGREIDKPALTRLIAQALTEAEARGRAAALAVPPVPTAGCEEVQVKESTCYLRFGVPSGKRKTIDLGRSVRDEMLIADLDEFGRVIGIELVGGVEKPCQSLPSPPQEPHP